MGARLPNNHLLHADESYSQGGRNPFDYVNGARDVSTTNHLL